MCVVNGVKGNNEMMVKTDIYVHESIYIIVDRRLMEKVIAVLDLVDIKFAFFWKWH